LNLHAEIPIKVNAWVDEGVAPLVAALNELENVVTVASCEHDQSDMVLGAYELSPPLASAATWWESNGPPLVHRPERLRIVKGYYPKRHLIVSTASMEVIAISKVRQDQ
jgi:hypothetical protein